MTGIQIKNRLIKILKLARGEVGVVSVNHLESSGETIKYLIIKVGLGFPRWFKEYVYNFDLPNTNLLRIEDDHIVLPFNYWEAILASITIINNPDGTTELRTNGITQLFRYGENRPQTIIPTPREYDAIPEPSPMAMFRQEYPSSPEQPSRNDGGVRLTYDQVSSDDTNPYLDEILEPITTMRVGTNPFGRMMGLVSPVTHGRPTVWTVCVACQKRGRKTEYILITMEKWVCYECIVEKYLTCDNCVRYYHKEYDGSSTIDGKNYCNNCFNVKAFHCERDGKNYSGRNCITTTSGFTICMACKTQYYTECNQCGNFDENSRIMLCGVCDRKICRMCRSDHTRSCMYRELPDNPPFFDGVKENSQLPFGRYVGVEIEAEKGEMKNLNKEMPKDVGITGDGSLHDKGIEIQTPPATYDKLEKFVVETTKVLKYNGYKGTMACGLHLHFDARDIMNDHIKIIQVIKTFYAIEDIIYSMLPPSRWGTHFCQQLSKNYLYDNFKKQMKKNDAEKEIYKATNMKDISRRKNHKYDASRYYGLNIHSIFFRGTIELRYHSGTVEDWKILNWIDITSRIVDYAINTYDEKVIEGLFNMPTSWEKFKAFRNLFKLKDRLSEYMTDRISKFNPNFIVKFNEGKEMREFERKEIKKINKIVLKKIKELYPKEYEYVKQAPDMIGESRKRLRAWAIDRATELARKQLPKSYFFQPLDGGFIQDYELDNIRTLMEGGRKLAQQHDGDDEPEM